MSHVPDLNYRRQWFEAYRQRVAAGATPLPPVGLRYTCPCCGYPTLQERRCYEICELCHWEDDGQDDPCADDVRGGPNSSYSLAEARSNFTQYMRKHSPDKTPRAFDRPWDPTITTTKAAKQAIMAACDQMLEQTDPRLITSLWKQVGLHEQILRREVRRGTRAFEIYLQQERAKKDQ
ncbi:MAG TPA: CPCC family cysteine-rich protein [Chloroflexia bacterium]|nr:CPCC family cysteine-rich protein [Chloroflexia bacterium]